ncbi:MAG: helix-turn-helix domain containing protein [Actinomycetota bacterium]|nr:helix-turn-helix domain containing protein [Actinomycetota bacterium]
MSKQMVANTAIRDRTLAAILAAASRMIAERGQSVSMHEIAESAGVGRATLYRYFPTREALIVQLFETAVDEASRAVDSLQLGSLPVCQAVERLTLEMLSFADTYRTVLMDEAVEGLRHRAKDVIGPKLQSLFAERIESGELRSEIDPVSLVRYFGGLVRMAAFMVADSGRDRVKVSAELADLFCNGAATRQS